MNLPARRVSLFAAVTLFAAGCAGSEDVYGSAPSVPSPPADTNVSASALPDSFAGAIEDMDGWIRDGRKIDD